MAIAEHAGGIFIILIRKVVEQEKVGKLFLKIGRAGYTNGSLKADINAGMIIA